MRVPVRLTVEIRSDSDLGMVCHLRSALDGPTLCGLPVDLDDRTASPDGEWSVHDGSFCETCGRRWELIDADPVLRAAWRDGDLRPELLDP